MFVPPKSDSVIEAIGTTSLVKIQKLNPNPSVEIYAKLEGLNPGGSIKDRITKKMIKEGEESGELTPGKTILEPTSGNTGIGLAMIAARKGYEATFVMPASVSRERALILKAFGADVIVTPSEEGTDGAIEKAEEMAAESDKYWIPDQFSNEANFRAHYETTGPEIWEATGGRITHFVAGIGTGGTVTGVGKYLKEKDSSVKVVGVEPETKNGIQGLKNTNKSIKPEVFQEGILDRKMKLDPEESTRWAKRLAEEEGIFAGQSSGAAIQASRKVAAKLDKGVVVTIFPDSGFKYLSSEPYSDVEIEGKIEEAEEEGKTVQI
ncbi:MAG: PLP-dependent cysteine synthase family protein [Candidatus Aenigmatarchaeota archaeon]